MLLPPVGVVHMYVNTCMYFDTVEAAAPISLQLLTLGL